MTTTTDAYPLHSILVTATFRAAIRSPNRETAEAIAAAYHDGNDPDEINLAGTVERWSPLTLEATAEPSPDTTAPLPFAAPDTADPAPGGCGATLFPCGCEGYDPA